jgi:hypothetical protein
VGRGKWLRLVGEEDKDEDDERLLLPAGADGSPARGTRPRSNDGSAAGRDAAVGAAVALKPKAEFSRPSARSIQRNQWL